MPEAADPMDGDDIAGSCAGMTERVEGGDPAPARGQLDGVEVVRHMRDRRDMGDHMRGVAAVAAHAGRLMDILAGEGAVAPAMIAVAAGAAEPADAGARADAPALDRPIRSASTVPITSWPGTRGYRIGMPPSTVSASLWQTPQAWTLTRMSSGPGTGTSRSSAASGPPAL